MVSLNQRMLSTTPSDENLPDTLIIVILRES